MRLKITTVLASLSLALCSQTLSAEIRKLKNGAELLVEQDTRAPRSTVSVIFLGGAGLIKPEEQGVAGVLTTILDEGPEGMTNEEFKNKLFLLGGEIDFTVGTRLSYVRVTAPKETLPEVLRLGLASLKKPKFDQETYKIALQKVSSFVALNADDMGTTLRYYSVRDAFAQHPDTLDGSTSPTSMKNVTLEKVKASLPKLFDARYAFTGAVGPSDAGEFEKVLNAELETAGFLADKLEKRAFTSAAKDVLVKGKRKVVLLHKPGATDNQIRYLTRRNVPRDNLDAVSLNLANRALGGGMQSALFRTLREERGLTYSAGSGVNENIGLLLVSSFASTDKVAKLMQGIDEVVAKQANEPIDAAKTDLLKLEAITGWKEGRELPSDLLFDNIRARVFGRDLSFIENLDDWFNKAKPEDVNRLGQQFLSTKDATIYVMGDKTKLLPILEQVGFKKADVRVVDAKTIP